MQRLLRVQLAGMFSYVFFRCRFSSQVVWITVYSGLDQNYVELTLVELTGHFYGMIADSWYVRCEQDMCSASRGRMGMSSHLIPDLDVSSRQ